MTSSIAAPGKSYPIGATVVPGGVNFSVYSRNATGVELVLFDRVNDPRPSRTIPIDPAENRSYHYWHVFVPQIHPGQLYGYRVHGPFDPSRGMRFDPTRILLDPYTRAIAVPENYNRAAMCRPGDQTAAAMKSVVADPRAYDWEGDAPLRRPAARTIIYEMHVRGFTQHPSSGVPQELRGTYAGLIQKIPYLQELGITAVELLPVFQFDWQDAPEGLVNYWGYAPVSFFTPHHGYCSRPDPLGPMNEFRDMVKALHRAGIEVILDVVFNHTAEGGENGPTLSFRGLDNTTYYILGRDPSQYANFSGTGNTLNANQPIVRRMVVDSLRYWVEEMHVDGFRFDLAAVLERDGSGNLLPSPPVLWDIESHPALAGVKLIAEAWDAAGLYQVGSFAGDSWREWNGRFRDDVRSFFRGDDGTVSLVADRLVGSPQIYAYEEREAEQSVNFVTCHDGFTLNDLVSYNHKHNEANREDNRDGVDDNRSYNWGVEGPTGNPAIEMIRIRQMKNLLATTILSLGMPMLLMGDEVRRTQRGNNNAYCQDNETSWFDWTMLANNAGMHRFVTMLCKRRLRQEVRPDHQCPSLSQLLRTGHLEWHGVEPGHPDWGLHSHSLAFTIEEPTGKIVLYFVLNAWWEPLDFKLPPPGNSAVPWRRWMDTSLESPDDVVQWHSAPLVATPAYRVAPRSIVGLYIDLGAVS